MTTDSKTIIIPLTDQNRQGIDDLIDASRRLFEGSIRVIEAYVVETDNPGFAVLCEALSKSSGVSKIEAPKAVKKYKSVRGQYKQTMNTAAAAVAEGAQ